jgi:hypothetical protein
MLATTKRRRSRISWVRSSMGRETRGARSENKEEEKISRKAAKTQRFGRREEVQKSRPRACSTRWNIERPCDAPSAHAARSIGPSRTQPVEPALKGVASRQARELFDHFRRRHPLELQRGMQRPSASALRRWSGNIRPSPDFGGRCDACSVSLISSYPLRLCAFA